MRKRENFDPINYSEQPSEHDMFCCEILHNLRYASQTAGQSEPHHCSVRHPTAIFSALCTTHADFFEARSRRPTDRSGCEMLCHQNCCCPAWRFPLPLLANYSVDTGLWSAYEIRDAKIRPGRWTFEHAEEVASAKSRRILSFFDYKQRPKRRGKKYIRDTVLLKMNE